MSTVADAARRTPSPAVAVGAFLGYLVVFYGVWILMGIDYDRIGESSSTVARWYVAPLAAGAVYLVAVVSWLGWWRPVLRERRKVGPAWLWIAPVLMALIAVVLLVSSDMTGVTLSIVLLLVVGSVGVGFCEEVATRGVLLAGFRARMTEPMAWFLSTLLFGLLHLPNWVFGAGPGAMLQVLLAFMTGSALYLARRLSGSLLLPMILHGFWDFAGFIGDTPDSVAGLAVLNGLVALGLVLVLVRRDRGTAPERCPP